MIVRKKKLKLMGRSTKSLFQIAETWKRNLLHQAFPNQKKTTMTDKKRQIIIV
jgi:hypothetical protein